MPLSFLGLFENLLTNILRRVAALEFSRGFQPTVGEQDGICVALATLEFNRR